MKCQVVLAPSKVTEVDAPDGCSVLAAVELAFPGRDLSPMTVFHAGESLDLETAAVTPLTESRVILAEAIIGKVATPTVRDTIRYFRRRGYTLSPGKGDHINLNRPTGGRITLNRDNSDPNHLDLASAKDAAKEIGVPLHELSRTLRA